MKREKEGLFSKHPSVTIAKDEADASGLAPSEEGAAFRRPKIAIPVPVPAARFQQVQAGVPDTQLAREATGLLREFSTPLLFNHSHRVFFWANELGRQSGKKFDVELVFICA